MTRRNFLLGAVAPIPAGAAWGVTEARWLNVVHAALPDAPARPIRLLHISDLHASVWVPRETIDSAIHQAETLRPDLICITGDFITRRTGFEPAVYREQLRRLARVAPAFATLGNHDGGVWSARRGGLADTSSVRALLAAAGIELLHNRNVTIGVDGRRLNLVGVGDLWSRQIDSRKAFAGAAPDAVLLSHNPDSKDLVRGYPWRLMLSGHTHGGQLRVPVFGTPFAPVKDRRYVDGLREWEGRHIHVTRGVGNTLGMRWNCPPEINLLEV
ncbi:MAG: phosphodiesterase YaeI [Bryobacteraceae bacterium]